MNAVLSVILILYGLIDLLIKQFLWGVTSYVIFRLISKNINKWKFPALISSLLFFVWNDIIVAKIAKLVGFNIKNNEVIHFLGSMWRNVYNIDLFDAIFDIGLTFVFFFIGSKLFEKIENKSIAK